MTGPMAAQPHRTFLLAGLGIAALSAGSMVLVTLRTAGDSAANRPTLASPVTSGTPPSAPGARAAVLPAPAAPPVDLPGDAVAAARARREAMARSSIPVADRPTRRVVRRALLSPRIQSRLRHCLVQDGGFGATAGRAPRIAPATLVLELERLRDEVVIADVGLRRWGGASQQAFSCARDALRGQTVAGPPGLVAGSSWMEFPLNPRGGELALTP